MKKVLLVVLAVGLMVCSADAFIVKGLKVSGSTTIYYGSPRTALPSVGYLYMDNIGGADVVWTYNVGAAKYFAGPFPANVVQAWDGGVPMPAKCTVGLTTHRTDVDATLAPIRVNGALWGLSGGASGVGSIPSSLRGYIDMEVGLGTALGTTLGVFDIASGNTIGGGYGAGSAYAYFSVNDMISTSASIAQDKANMLSGQGYSDSAILVNPVTP